MTKFKVGDRVRVNESGGCWCGVKGTVKSIAGRFTYVLPDEGSKYSGINDGMEVLPSYMNSGAGLYHENLDLIQDVQAPAIDAHYTKHAIQPMEFSLANGLDAAQHTVVKYVVRYKDKHGIRDLKAAIRVLELMIEREEKANG